MWIWSYVHGVWGCLFEQYFDFFLWFEVDFRLHCEIYRTNSFFFLILILSTLLLDPYFTTTTTTTTSSPFTSKLSTGAITGIAVGASVGAVVVAAVTIYLVLKAKRRSIYSRVSG
jgi:hypothetical protein